MRGGQVAGGARVLRGTAGTAGLARHADNAPEAIELLSYDTLVVKGLLQTEGYMRAVLAMRRPPLDQETIEQRVAARLARQDIFDRQSAPLLSFVMDESVLRRRLGGKNVLQGQLEHLLLVGQKRNVEIQIMPLECEESAGVDGAFTVTRRAGSPRLEGARAGPPMSARLIVTDPVTGQKYEVDILEEIF